MVEIIHRVAEKSLEWRDTDKISFIWNNELVIAYVNKEYNLWYSLTDLSTEVIIDINNWLGTYLQTLEDLEENE